MLPARAANARQWHVRTVVASVHCAVQHDLHSPTDPRLWMPALPGVGRCADGSLTIGVLAAVKAPQH